MALQHFFVGGKHLGSRLIPDYRRVPGLEIRWHHSYAIFCGRCGDIWGRLLHDKAEYTQMIQRACLRHGDGALSWLHNFEGEPTSYESDWPLGAARNEFAALMQHAIKELES